MIRINNTKQVKIKNHIVVKTRYMNINNAYNV